MVGLHLLSLLSVSVLQPIWAINSATQTIAISLEKTVAGQDENTHFAEVEDKDGDQIALLQTSLIKSGQPEADPEEEVDPEQVVRDGIPQPIFSRIDEDQASFGSFTSEDNLYCIEGDLHDTQMSHSLMRATPITSLYYSHWYEGGVTCASRGYDQLLQEHDDCWNDFTRWIRTGSPPERVAHGVATGGQWTALLDHYDQERGYPMGTSRGWVACDICSEDSLVRNGAWGESYDCGVVFAELASRVRQGPPRSSFIPDNELGCFEGPREYLEGVLSNTRTTPMGSLFLNTEIVDQDCGARGYDSFRDGIDECWPGAAKMMRLGHEADDMLPWVWAYFQAIQDYDSSDENGGLWSNLDWVACRACEEPGAVRGRGLWVTMHGGDAVPYTEAYCQSTVFPDLTSRWSQQ